MKYNRIQGKLSKVNAGYLLIKTRALLAQREQLGSNLLSRGMCGFLLPDGGTVHKPNFPWVFLTMEKEMEIHSTILAWRIPWTGEPAGLQSIGLHRVRHERLDSTHSHHGDALQYSCLENPIDKEARRATVHGGHTESDMPERLFGWLVSHHNSQCQSSFPPVKVALTLTL